MARGRQIPTSTHLGFWRASELLRASDHDLLFTKRLRSHLTSQCAGWPEGAPKFSGVAQSPLAKRCRAGHSGAAPAPVPRGSGRGGARPRSRTEHRGALGRRGHQRANGRQAAAAREEGQELGAFEDRFHASELCASLRLLRGRGEEERSRRRSWADRGGRGAGGLRGRPSPRLVQRRTGSPTRRR